MWKAKKILLVLGDTLFLYLSLFGALLIRYGKSHFIDHLSPHLIPFSALFIVWLSIFYIADLYRSSVFSTPGKLFRSLLQALIASGIVSVIMLYLFTNFFSLTPKTNLVLTGVIFFLLDYTFRFFFLSAFSAGSIQIYFLGTSPFRKELEEHLSANPHVGYATAEWIERPDAATFQKLRTLETKNETNIIVVAPDLIRDADVSKKIYELLPHDAKVINLLDFYEELFEKIPLELLEPTWFIEHISTRRSFYDVIKRLVDLLVGGILFLVLLLPGILIALVIALTSRGPIFYTEPRASKNGETFTLFKFRSMVDHAAEKGPAWTEKNDNRITPLGKILRFTHLDEIPQLLNILRGDISFTGPRPEATRLAEKYQELPFYEMRHAVKPGLTGWAQINYRPSASLEEAYEKLRYDIFYVKNRSFFLDILIMLRTLKHLFFSHR